MILHLVLPGTADGPLGVAVDVVATAARLVDAGLARPPARSLRQRVVSLDGRAVRSGLGRPIAVDGALPHRGLGRGDAVVIAGLSATTPAAVAALLARPDVARVADRLPRLAARGVTIAASCSATFVLGAAGLLAGRRATTTWWLAPELARRFPTVELDADRMVVDAGGVITAGAALAHADLMLALIARLGGPALAERVARYLVLDARPAQARYLIVDHLRHADPAVRAVERLVAGNLHRQLGLAELARAAATSPRTLARRFRAALGTTPLAFVQRARAAHAAHLLATTTASVDDIAAQVGYADAAAFRRVFRRVLGASPRQARRLR